MNRSANSRSYKYRSIGPHFRAGNEFLPVVTGSTARSLFDARSGDSVPLWLRKSDFRLLVETDSMPRQPLTSRKKILLGAAVVVPVLLVFTFSSRGLLKRIELEQTESRLEQELDREREIADSLAEEIELLETDSTAVEKVARERYGMIRPGEEVYTIEEPSETEPEERER